MCCDALIIPLLLFNKVCDFMVVFVIAVVRE